MALTSPPANPAAPGTAPSRAVRSTFAGLADAAWTWLFGTWYPFMTSFRTWYATVAAPELVALQTDVAAKQVTASAAQVTASAAAVSSAADAAAVAATYDLFDDRFLGAKAADPTLDNDGNALQNGAIYINTVSGLLRGYTTVGGWVNGSAGVAGVSSLDGNVGALVLKTVGGTAILGAGDIPLAAVAAQADQETGTDIVKVVTPGRQKFHPSACKAWLKGNAAGAVQASYNVSSLTDTGTGIATVNLTTAFSSVDYAVALGALQTSAMIITLSSQATTNFVVKSYDAVGTLTDPTNYYAACFGDQ